MSKVKLFIATSLDGFIAREDGALDWLEAIPNPDQLDFGYATFYDTVDTLIMGRSTYDEVLGFGVDWPYPDARTYILTSKANYQTSTPRTEVLNELSLESIDRLKTEANKDIWLVGGGKVITEFLNLGLVDEMLLTIIPTILGKGIRIFPDAPKETSFELIDSETFANGIVNLVYRLKS